MIVHVGSRIVNSNILEFENSSAECKLLKKKTKIKACFLGFIGI